MSFLKNRKDMIEKYREINQDQSHRMTGQTTGIALTLIGFAMRNPELPIKIVVNAHDATNPYAYPGIDHQGGISGRDNLFRTVLDKLTELKLEGFKVDRRHYTITYSLEYNEGNYGSDGSGGW